MVNEQFFALFMLSLIIYEYGKFRMNIMLYIIFHYS